MVPSSSRHRSTRISTLGLASTAEKIHYLPPLNVTEAWKNFFLNVLHLQLNRIIIPKHPDATTKPIHFRSNPDLFLQLLPNPIHYILTDSRFQHNQYWPMHSDQFSNFFKELTTLSSTIVPAVDIFSLIHRLMLENSANPAVSFSSSTPCISSSSRTPISCIWPPSTLLAPSNTWKRGLGLVFKEKVSSK